MSKPICVDASLALKLVLDETDSEIAKSLWRNWVNKEAEFVAPPLFVFESVSAIRLKVTRKQISEELAESAFQDFQELLQDMKLLNPPDLSQHAWNLAKELRQSQVYDAYYLALAEILDCEFWTADRKLYSSVHHDFPRIKHLTISQ